MIKKISDKNYSVFVSLGINPLTGKQERYRKQGIKTKKEAEIYEAEAINKKFHSDFIIDSKLNIEQLAQRFFTHYCHDKKFSYITLQAGMLKNHIKPFFKTAKIKDIRFKDIQDFKKYLINKKINNKTINKILIFTKQLFDVALNEQIISKNPTLGIKKLKEQKSNMKFWTLDEFKYFLSLINQNEKHLHVFYLTDFWTGLRGGEIVALKWSDLLINTSELSINKTSNFLKGKYVITEPKTQTSIRRVAINKKLLNTLLAWKKEQKKMLEKLGVDYNESDIYIFQYANYPPLRDYYSRSIKKICSRSENHFEPIRLHDLRHSHVAYLINKDEKTSVIKERLGHASITTTVDVYGHLYPNKQKELSDAFDDDF